MVSKQVFDTDDIKWNCPNWEVYWQRFLKFVLRQNAAGMLSWPGCVVRTVTIFVHVILHVSVYTGGPGGGGCASLRENVRYVKVHRYNPKHLYPKLNGYGDNGERSLKVCQLLHTYWLPNTY